MNQESPAPRRRSNFRAPGSVDAEALTRVFGDAATGDLAAAAPPAPAPEATAPPAASGRRASTRPVDEPPKHRAERPGNRRAVEQPSSLAPSSQRGRSRKTDEFVTPAPATPVTASAESGPAESVPAEPVPTATASAEPEPTEPVLPATASAESVSAESGPAELVPAASASAEPVPAEPVPAATASAEPGPTEPVLPVTASAESAAAELASAESMSAERTAAEPLLSEPALSAPALAEPVVPGSALAEPLPPESSPEPARAEPAAAAPASAERAASAHSTSPAAEAFPWRLAPAVPVAIEPDRPSPEATASRRGRRRAVVAAAVALTLVTGVGALAVANDVPASWFASASHTPAPSDALAGASAPAVTSGLSATAAPFTGGTSITVTGERLDQVTQVSVGGASAAILEASGDHLTFAVPATTSDAVGPTEVVFAGADGRPVRVSADAPDASTSADASPEPGASSEASAPATDAAGDSLTLTYTTDPGIDAQLAYVLEYWDDYNTAEYPAVPGKDAVNFASQSLIARGWTMDDAWNVDPATGAMSAAWSSSTALRDYLLTRTDRATELTDAQRDQVKVGDLAQFDWDGSGDRDHTAVVTRVERTDAGTKVWVASHTKDADYWDVDAALASGGGSVSFFSIR